MDYFKILNLDKDPFSNSPDPDFFFRSEEHFACLTKIQNAIYSHRGGLNLIIGDVGSGKTTLGRQLIRILSNDNAYETHLILDPGFDTLHDCLTRIAELFEGIGNLGERDDHQIKQQMVEYLLRKRQDEQKTTVLIIDEGQKIPGFCLDVLYDFLNYEKAGNALLQVVILAQKEFEKTLKENTAFSDRISLCLKLGPMNFRDTRQMIQFRMNQSVGNGNAPSLFSFPALWGIYRHTKGYPRKIIHICHQTILAMIVANRTRIGWLLVIQCIRKQRSGQDKKISWATPVAVFSALVVITGAIIGLSEKKQVSANNNTHPSPSIPVAPKEAIRQSGERLKSLTSQIIASEKRKNVIAPPIILEEPEEIYDQLLEIPSTKENNEKPGSDDATMSRYGVNNGDSTPVGNSTTMAELVTMRGGMHDRFFRIVLEFTEKVQYEDPVIQDNQAVIRLQDTQTHLKSFRKYKTFDSWLSLDQKGNDIDVRIGLPENVLKYNCFKLVDPWRLIIDVFTAESKI